MTATPATTGEAHPSDAALSASVCRILGEAAQRPAQPFSRSELETFARFVAAPDPYTDTEGAGEGDSAEGGMSREELAEALTATAHLLYGVWRGRITSPSAEVGAALDAYMCHPSHLLGCSCHPRPAPAVSAGTCDGSFRCPASTHIEGCFTGEGHPGCRPVSAGGQDSAEPWSCEHTAADHSDQIVPFCAGRATPTKDTPQRPACHIDGHPDWCECPVVRRDQCRGSDLCCVNCGNPWGSRHDPPCHGYAKARKAAAVSAQERP